MLPSSGYFRSVSCPFFVSGLCERPHCHFRHVRPDAQQTWPGRRSSAEDAALPGVAAASAVPLTVPSSVTSTPAPSGTDMQPDLLKLVADAIRQVQKEVEEDQARFAKSISIPMPAVNTTTASLINPASFLLPTINTSSVAKQSAKTEPVAKKSVHFEDPPAKAVAASAVPEYKPTPIAELKKMRQVPSPSLVSAEDSKPEITTLEYDPVCNFSASLNPVVKRHSASRETVGYVPTTKRKLEKPSYSTNCKVLKRDDVLGTESNDSVSSFGGSGDDYNPGFVDDASSSGGEEKAEEEEKVKEENAYDLVNSILSQSVKCSSLMSAAKNRNELLRVKNKIRCEGKVVGDEKAAVESETVATEAEKKQKAAAVKTVPAKGDHDGTVKAKESKNKDSSTSVSKKVSNTASNVERTKADGECSVVKKPKDVVKSGKSKSDQSATQLPKEIKIKSSVSNKKVSANNCGSSSENKKKSQKVVSKPCTDATKAKVKSSKKPMAISGDPDKAVPETTPGNEKSGNGTANSISKVKHKTGKVCPKSPKSSSSSKKNNKTEKSSPRNSPKKPHNVKTEHDHRNNTSVSEAVHIPDTDGPTSGPSMEGSDQVLDSSVLLMSPNIPEEDPDTDLDEHDTYEECLRIFNEYVPSTDESATSSKKVLAKDAKKNAEETNSVAVGKKRIAHDAGLSKRPTAPPLKRVSAAEAMHNRFVQSQAQARKIQSPPPVVSLPEPIRTPSPPPPPPSVPYPYALPRSPVRQGGTPSVASIILNTAAAACTSKRRIAHVPTAIPQNLLSRNAKCKAQPAVSEPSPVDTPSTIVVTKGVPRVAHMPTAVASSRPTIPVEFGSKVPSSIRQRYLNIFIDECLKIYDTQQDAYDRALAEEKSAYDRSTNRTVYLNVTVNAIKRLRSERTASATARNPSAAKPASSAQPTAKSRLTPLSQALNRKLSHEFVLGGRKALTTSYSIERPKQKKVCDISGAALYEFLKSYILTPAQLEEHGFPWPHPTESGRAVIKGKDNSKKRNNPIERTCCRCGTLYQVDLRGAYFNLEECVYHYGKPWKKKIAGALETSYSCCGGDLQSSGCCVGKLHVSDNCDYDNLRGFVKTLPRSPPMDGNCGVYALDCEMCYTTMGCELTRITVIGPNLKPVYESLVKPENPVVDYNTQFSGIKEEDMRGVATSIRDVQAVLLNKFGSETILIGHSLDSDFKALKLIHGTVVDTSVVFPHKRGLPFKRALRNLTAEYLKKLIQNDVGGHDSNEDAAACMELMLWKVKEDAKRSGL